MAHLRLARAVLTRALRSHHLLYPLHVRKSALGRLPSRMHPSQIRLDFQPGKYVQLQRRRTMTRLACRGLFPDRLRPSAGRFLRPKVDLISAPPALRLCWQILRRPKGCPECALYPESGPIQLE